MLRFEVGVGPSLQLSFPGSERSAARCRSRLIQATDEMGISRRPLGIAMVEPFARSTDPEACPLERARRL